MERAQERHTIDARVMLVSWGATARSGHVRLILRGGMSRQEQILPMVMQSVPTVVYVTVDQESVSV